MIKLLAFDWNGTLLSDTATCCNAANRLFKDYGKKPLSVQRYRQTFRIPVIDFYCANGFEKKFLIEHSKEMSKKFIGYYEPIATHCRSRSGAKDLLRWLSKNKLPTILFSNHTLTGIQAQLTRLNLSQYINKILAHDTSHHNNMRKRGKGDKLIAYISQQGYKKNEVVVIGDTDEEIEIGKMYGFHTVGITGGHQIAAHLKKHHPDFLIHNMVELKKIIKKLNS